MGKGVLRAAVAWPDMVRRRVVERTGKEGALRRNGQPVSCERDASEQS
jgi:hypothetical protein